MRQFLPQAKSSPITLARGRTRVRVLPNGLTLLVEPDHSAPVTSVQVWVQTGSIHEGSRLGSGLSHFLEHMIFKGTATRGPNDIARAVQEIGGQVNAYTSFDRTVYWISTPAHGTATAIELLADAVLHSTIPEEEFVKEQEVIRREFAMGFDDPGRMSSELMLATAFIQSPYRYPIIGHLEIFNELTRDDLVAYYQERYVPDNMFLVVTGDIEPADIFSLAGKWFGSAKRCVNAPRFIPQEPPQLGRREAQEEFETELSRCSLVWHIPPLTHGDSAILEVLAMVLGGGRSAPLHLELREKKNLVHHIGAYSYMAGEMGLFGVDFVCDPQKRFEAEQAVLAVIARYCKGEASDAELTKARKAILADQLSSLATANGRASDIGASWLLARNPDLGVEYLERVSSVTAADLRRATCEYLSPTTCTVTSVNPRGSLSNASSGESFDSVRRIEMFTLPNGLRVLTCEDRKLPVVSTMAVFRGGLLAETADTNGLTALAGRTLIKGTTTRTSEQIDHEIESVGGHIAANFGHNNFSVSVETMVPDLRLGLELLADVLLNATFPKEEIEREKEDQIAALKAEDEQITAIARNAMRRAVFGAHPYGLRSNGTPESIASITQAQLRAFRDQCVTARNGVLAIFGDINTEEIRQLAKKLFGTLPAGELLMTDPPVAPALSEAHEIVVHEPKQQAVIMVGFRGVSAHDPDLPALELIEAASSDMASRFFQRIREELGLAYFVGAAQQAGFAPGIFTFYLGTDPTKADMVRGVFEDEIALLAREGLTNDELERAKKKMIGTEAIGIQSLGAFLSVAAMGELYGFGYDHYKQRQAKFEAVTPEEVRAVAHKYFLEPHRTVVVVTPMQENPSDHG